MCGIVGSWGSRGNPGPEDAQRIVSRMMNTLHHRGPDSKGCWIDSAAGIALGHTRLSILDLSSAGHQPMLSASGKYVIVFNGEIYNHLELRQQLESECVAPIWVGHSDTETLLAAFEAWGVKATLDRLIGMFAFGLWNCRKRSLVLARDRMGEKPLYYGRAGKALVFASELKAIQAHSDFSPEIDRGALALLLSYNYIPTPFSIFTGISKLKPGCWLEILDSAPEIPEPRPYWSMGAIVEAGAAEPFRGTEADAADELERLLLDATRSQMLSDVPLGAFLSGGVDSSTIVALMQAQSDRPIQTFSIGFKEARFNEAEHAKAVAQHLGTNHTELYVTEQDALNTIPELPRIFDEPYADSSQIPTYLLAGLTRQQVTVAMSGDGGDELFGGYNRYLLAPRLWSNVAWLPAPIRMALGTLIEACPGRFHLALQKIIHQLLPHYGVSASLADKSTKIAEMLRRARNIDDLYVLLVSEWADPTKVVRQSECLPTMVSKRSSWPKLSKPEERMMALDAITYLPDDILVKVDRSSMAVSLETRAPFLDHRIVEFASRLPLEMKIKGNIGKCILRDVLYRYVPRELIERPKQGFGIPLDDWLRSSLRDWAEDLLSEDRLKSDGFFKVEPIRAVWRAHLTGERQYGYRLWSVLMFQSWLQRQREVF